MGYVAYKPIKFKNPYEEKLWLDFYKVNFAGHEELTYATELAMLADNIVKEYRERMPDKPFKMTDL